MDLISRKDVVTTIYERDNRLKRHKIYRDKGGSIDLLCVLPKIRAIPSAFEGMSNGEVMKAVFPNCYMGIDDDEWIVTNIDGRTMFQPEWWNAPYKAEREE